MQIAIIGDLHLGVKQDDPWMQENIFDTIKWFTEDCKQKGIKTCIQAGDFFDTRKAITQKNLMFVRERIIPLFQETFDATYVIVGNHDLHMKNVMSPNSCREVLGHVPNFHVVEEPTTITLCCSTYDLIPWICKENKERIYDFIKNSNSEFCVGHFELGNGIFEYYRGMKAEGEDPEFLEKYKHVLSGHFHCHSSASTNTGGTITYTGTPYTITLGDADDARGYWTHEPVQNQLTFFANPVTYHHKVYFDADTWNKTEKDLERLYKNKTIKLIIEKSHSDTNKVSIDKVLDSLENTVHELKFEYIQDSCSSDVDEVESVQTAVDIMKEYISTLDESDDIKDRVQKIVFGLYTEIMSTE